MIFQSLRIVILLVVLTFIPLSAAERDSFERCMDASEGIHSEMSACIDREIPRLDHLLNRYYRRAMARLSPSKRSELRSIERLWIKYRDANCNFYDLLTGGTMDPLNVSLCQLKMRQIRLKELQAIDEIVEDY